MLALTRMLLGPLAVATLLAAVLGFSPTVPSAAFAESAIAAVVADAEPGADLALVPADAAGFVHVRLADLWKNDIFSGLRKTWERAGEKALAALDQQFVPAPSSLDRATVFVLFDEQKKGPQVFGVLAFSKPFVPVQVAQTYLPKAEKKVVAGKTVYVDEDKGIEVSFPDNRHVLIGQEGTLEGYFTRPPAKDGPMAGALKLAATRPVVAAANIAALPIPPGALKDIPEEIRPLLKAELLLVALDLGDKGKLEVRASYKDAAAAGDAEKAVRALVTLGRTELARNKKELEDKLYDPNIKSPRPAGDLPEALGTVFALGTIGRIDDLLADPKLIARNGKDLVFNANMPAEMLAASSGFAAIAIGLLLPAVQKVREAASRATSQNNLKQISLAILNYEAAYGTLPADITDKNGKPILSWRVAILPFIEQDNIYKAMKMDEPWDSANNKEFSKSKIKTFMSPSSAILEDKDGYGVTSYKGAAGPDCVFEPGKKKLRIVDITDGTSNTISLLEAGDPIPWAKPGDFNFDPKKPLPKLDSVGKPGLCNVAMCDGSVRALNLKSVSEQTIKAALTKSGGEVLGKDW